MDSYNTSNTGPTQPQDSYYMPAPAVEDIPGLAGVSEQMAGTAPALPTQEPPKQPKGWATLIKVLIAVGVYFVVETIGYTVGLFTPIGEYFGYIGTGAIAGVALIALLGGFELIRIDKEAIRYAFSSLWWFVALSLGLMLLGLFSIVFSSDLGPVPEWPLMILWSFAICFLIGISEETLVRGLFHNGLLAIMGKTKAGIMWACVLSALFFGLLHVNLSALPTATPLEIAQGVGKVLQTGTYGFALAAIATRSHNVIGVALIHALDDFFLFVSGAIFHGTDILNTDYVVEGDEGISVLVTYAIFILLYLPMVIKAVKIIREIEPEERGSFSLGLKYEREMALYQANGGTQAEPIYPNVQTTPLQIDPKLPPIPQGFVYADTDLANSSQNTTADDAATFRESTS